MRDWFPKSTPVVILLLIAGLQVGFPDAATAFDYCGNGVCLPPYETQVSCPQDCGGGTTPETCADFGDCGNAIRNSCVPDIEQAFLGISHDDSEFKITNDGGVATGEWFWSDYLGESVAQSPCHFQGMTRLRQAPWIAMTANLVSSPASFLGGLFGFECQEAGDTNFGFGAVLWLARMDSKAQRGDGRWFSGWDSGEDLVRTFFPIDLDVDNFYHPGGIQAVGDFLLVGVDSEEDEPSRILTIDVTDPFNPAIINTINQAFDRAEAVGIVQVTGGGYLLAAGAHQSTEMNFWFTGNNTPTGFQFVGRLTQWNGAKAGNYNNIALARECGSNRLYLIGMYNTSTEVGGTNKAQLWHVTFPLAGPAAELIQTREFSDSGAAFFGGAGLYIRPSTGEIAIYASEKYPEDSFLPWKNNHDLDSAEWW